jgi:hypothetical protein
VTAKLSESEKSRRKHLRDEARREFKKRSPSEQLRARLRAAGSAGAAAKGRGMDKEGWPIPVRNPERAWADVFAKYQQPTCP